MLSLDETLIARNFLVENKSYKILIKVWVFLNIIKQWLLIMSQKSNHSFFFQKIFLALPKWYFLGLNDEKLIRI